MAGVEKRDFGSPDESRTPDKTQVDVVHLGGTTAARFTMEPGWSWSQCVKPVAGTDSCQHRHLGVVQSGRMRVMHDDGTKLEIGPGEAYVIEPGHDAEIVGDEQFVGYDFNHRLPRSTRVRSLIRTAEPSAREVANGGAPDAAVESPACPVQRFAGPHVGADSQSRDCVSRCSFVPSIPIV